MKKTDCFALTKHGRCDALNVPACPEECSFYKTAPQAERDRQRAERRIKQLSAEVQISIDNKYFLSFKQKMKNW